MGSESATDITSSMIEDSFNALEKQRTLIANCTLLWKELSDHFVAIEKDLEVKSQNLRSKRLTLDLATQQVLDKLHQRETSIDRSVELAIAKLDDIRRSAVESLECDANNVDLTKKIQSLCMKMDSDGFMNLVLAKRKEVEILRIVLPVALGNSIDPGKFVLDAVSRVFKSDSGWACVLILEALVSALEDPVIGSERLLVTRRVKERAKEVAEEWKLWFEGCRGIESMKPADVHAFLQHLVTFGIGAKEDREYYRMLVLDFPWRRQMPKLAISLGLKDQMADMIEELICRGQQLDAINFAYEAGLQDKFPPVPLLKSFLKDSNKASSSVSKEQNNSVQDTNSSRKKQSALKAVMKCIEDRQLEAEFPLEPLRKRLENLEKVKAKAKAEKKKPAASTNSPANDTANKRTRANNAGPMPPAKAGRLTSNGYVSSFPSTTYVQSPHSRTTYSPPIAPCPYDRQPIAHGVYRSVSPPSMRDPYHYHAKEVVAPAAIGLPYSSPPMNYPHHGVYGSAGTPGYQQAYYR